MMAGMRNVSLSASLLAVAACATTRTAAPTLAEHARSAAAPPPIARGLEIEADDRTGNGRGDQLQASALRAFGDVPGAGVVPAVELHVELNQLASAPRVGCKLSITVATADKSVLAMLTGGAQVDGGDAGAIDDCIDAVLEGLRARIAQLVSTHMDAAGARALADNTGSPHVRMYEFEGEVYEGDRPGVAPSVAERVLDKATIRRFVKAHDRGFQACYAAEQLVTPNLEGTVTVAFTITPEGLVRGAHATTSIAPELDACVVRAFRTLVFPESDGATEVVYPIELRAPPTGL
jgi:hypothetical protein